ncbi:MAG TPA: diguanylate cyclase [Pseudomonas sp.]|nr:diguanylate cyclase [Pseudomonas sp.]
MLVQDFGSVGALSGLIAGKPAPTGSAQSSRAAQYLWELRFGAPTCQR